MHNKFIQKMILLFLLISLPLYCMFYNEFSGKSLSAYMPYVFIASLLSIAALLYLLYSMTRSALKSARQEAELLALEQQQKLKEQQTKALADRRQQTLSLWEHMKEDLLVYRNLMDHEQYTEAASYLENLTSRFQEERFHPICSDNLINAILDSKRQIASQYNIRTSFQLLLPEKSNIENSDLSSIFFNLMDNGIEACRASRTSDPFIQITAKQTANFLTIHMLNSKDPDQKFDHKTTKTDPWAHGFGLAIIEDIASRYDGSCQWIDNGDVFESVVMVAVG